MRVFQTKLEKEADNFATDVTTKWRSLYLQNNSEVAQGQIDIPKHTRLYKRIVSTFLDNRGQELSPEQITVVVAGFAEKLLAVGVARVKALDGITQTSHLASFGMHSLYRIGREIAGPEVLMPIYVGENGIGNYQLKQEFQSIFDKARLDAGLPIIPSRPAPSIAKVNINESRQSLLGRHQEERGGSER